MATAKCPRCGEVLRVPDAPSFNCPTCNALISIKPKPQAKVSPVEPAGDPFAFTAKAPVDLSSPPAAPRRSSAAAWIAIAIGAALVLAGGGAAIALLLIDRGAPAVPIATAKAPEKAAGSTPAPPSLEPKEKKAIEPEIKPEPKPEPKKELSPFQREAKRFCEEAAVFLNLLDTEPPTSESEAQLRTLRSLYSRLPFSADPEKSEKQRRFFGLVYKLLEGSADSYLRYKAAERLAGLDPSPDVLATLKEIRAIHDEGKRQTRQAIAKLLEALDKSQKK